MGWGTLKSAAGLAATVHRAPDGVQQSRRDAAQQSHTQLRHRSAEGCCAAGPRPPACSPAGPPATAQRTAQRACRGTRGTCAAATCIWFPSNMQLITIRHVGTYVGQGVHQVLPPQAGQPGSPTALGRATPTSAVDAIAAAFCCWLGTGAHDTGPHRISLTALFSSPSWYSASARLACRPRSSRAWWLAQRTMWFDAAHDSTHTS